jgi:F0F1-type ATP synthase assembly protein I
MNPEKEPKISSQGYTRWLGFAVEFCGVLAVCCYLGFKLDEKLNTLPWFLLAGFFVGFSGMIYLIIKETSNLGRKK